MREVEKETTVAGVGDWFHANVYGEHVFGYIESVKGNGIYRVRTLFPFEHVGVMRRYQFVVQEPEITVADINVMIDMALETKDEKWFHELIEQRNMMIQYVNAEG